MAATYFVSCYSLAGKPVAEGIPFDDLESALAWVSSHIIGSNGNLSKNGPIYWTTVVGGTVVTMNLVISKLDERFVKEYMTLHARGVDSVFINHKSSMPGLGRRSPASLNDAVKAVSAAHVPLTNEEAIEQMAQSSAYCHADGATTTQKVAADYLWCCAYNTLLARGNSQLADDLAQKHPRMAAL